MSAGTPHTARVRSLPLSLARSLAFLLGVLALGLGPSAGAVIIASGDGSGDTTAPPDDFGFANVGAAAQTAVYLGNGWVVTANHVREGDVVLSGRAYPAVAGSKVRMHNAGGGVSPDLAVFRLQEPIPDLPSLEIPQAPPQPGQLVILVGNGFDRGARTEFEGRPGWYWGHRTHLRWGTNTVEQVGLTVSINVGDVTSAFSTDFSPGLPTPHEAQVAVGDSGGGAFVRNGDRWELAGVLFAADTFHSQPERTAIFGDTTFAVDLSVYRDQIVERTRQPACRDGLDDDADGLVDFPDDPGCRSPDDADELTRCPGDAATGDANGDGRADGRDYEIWTEHLGEQHARPADGDFDCDGDVDAADFFLWRDLYEAGRGR